MDMIIVFAAFFALVGLEMILYRRELKRNAALRAEYLDEVTSHTRDRDYD